MTGTKVLTWINGRLANSFFRIHGSKHRPWLTALLARRPAKVAAIALANKLARMAWAMMARARGTGTRSWCVGPAGHLPIGDSMLAQKIAIETDEQAALAVANRDR